MDSPQSAQELTSGSGKGGGTFGPKDSVHHLERVNTAKRGSGSHAHNQGGLPISADDEDHDHKPPVSLPAHDF